MAVNSGCHLIAVLGGKGGVGKSIFAANFAIAVSNELKGKTLLIDLDSKSCGDQNIILGLRPEKTITDLCNHSSALTASAFASYVTKHPSGIDYLASVVDPTATVNIDSVEFSKSLNTFSQFYKYIIVDLGNNMDRLQHAVLEDVSAAIVVTTPDILTVNQTRRCINDLVTATFPVDLFQIVINKAHSSGLNPKSISDSLRRPLLSVIPQDDNLVYSSLANGSPFCHANPRHPVALAHNEAIRKLTGGTLQRLKALSLSTLNSKKKDAPKQASGPGNLPKLDDNIQLKVQIHSELIHKMDLKKDIHSTRGDAQKEKELELKTQKIITELVDQMAKGLNRDDRSRIIKEVLDEALKLGALEDLLADPSVTEIMVNGCEKIFIEKNGKIQRSPTRFTSNEQLRNVIERIVTPLGRLINNKTPYVDARLQDGSRVNAVIEPLAIDGPSLTIRKFSKDTIGPEDYIKWNSMNMQMAELLRICVQQGLNIIISGGTGSGKTTLLNMLSGFIPANERIVTVEDAAELQMKQDHVVRLETRPAGMDGSGAITIRDLVKNSLRMRPDRIVVGECRDGAALDMLQAMNTGHDGSMTTVHANSPREAVARLETLCLMAGMDLPVRAIKEQIAGAVNLFVQIGRLSDGSRKIKYITEVEGMQGDVITLSDIFRFKEEGFDKNRKIVGSFQSTGTIPTFVQKFKDRGVHIPDGIFSNDKPLAAPDKNPKRSAALGARRRPAPPGVPAKKAGNE